VEAEVGVDAACALPLVEVAAVGAEAAAGVAKEVAEAVAHLQVVEEFAAAGVDAEAVDAFGFQFVEAKAFGDQFAVGDAHHVEVGVAQVVGADLAKQALGT